MRRGRGCKRDGREKKERDDDDVFCRVKERVEKDGRPREEEKREEEGRGGGVICIQSGVQDRG